MQYKESECYSEPYSVVRNWISLLLKIETGDKIKITDPFALLTADHSGTVMESNSGLGKRKFDEQKCCCKFSLKFEWVFAKRLFSKWSYQVFKKLKVSKCDICDYIQTFFAEP